jgi:hypothetical protein
MTIQMKQYIDLVQHVMVTPKGTDGNKAFWVPDVLI